MTAGRPAPRCPCSPCRDWRQGQAERTDLMQRGLVARDLTQLDSGRWEATPREGDKAHCRKCREEVTVLGGTWTGPDGGINCLADTSAVFAWHEP